jgi:hypothetical protein
VCGLSALRCIDLAALPEEARMRERAEEWGRPLEDARARAWLRMARGRDSWLRGMPGAAAEELAQAEELFRTRCEGAATEMRLCRAALAYLAVVFGSPASGPTLVEWAREAEQHEDLAATTRLRLLAAVRVLATDDPHHAASEIAQAVTRWGREEDDLVAVLEVRARGELDLYAGDAQQCFGAVYRCDALFDSALSRLAPFRADALLLHARLAVAAAAGAREPAALLARAEEDVREAVALGLPCFAHHARLVRAAAAARRGDPDTALALLQAVLADPSEAPDAVVTTACAGICKGTLVGGDEGRALCAQGETALREAGVTRPDRYCRLYAPGFVG